MDPLTAGERSAIIQASPLQAKYGQRIDRESAEELLAARVSGDRAQAEAVREAAAPAPPREAPRSDDSLLGTVGDLLNSRQGQAISKEVVRGVFGMLKKRR